MWISEQLKMLLGKGMFGSTSIKELLGSSNIKFKADCDPCNILD